MSNVPSDCLYASQMYVNSKCMSADHKDPPAGNSTPCTVAQASISQPSKVLPTGGIATEVSPSVCLLSADPRTVVPISIGSSSDPRTVVPLFTGCSAVGSQTIIQPNIPSESTVIPAPTESPAPAVPAEILSSSSRNDYQPHDKEFFINLYLRILKSNPKYADVSFEAFYEGCLQKQQLYNASRSRINQQNPHLCSSLDASNDECNSKISHPQNSAQQRSLDQSNLVSSSAPISRDAGRQTVTCSAPISRDAGRQTVTCSAPISSDAGRQTVTCSAPISSDVGRQTVTCSAPISSDAGRQTVTCSEQKSLDQNNQVSSIAIMPIVAVGQSATSSEQVIGDIVTSSEQVIGDIVTSTGQVNGHSITSGAYVMGHSVMSGEQVMGHSVTSDAHMMGQNATSGEQVFGHSVISGEHAVGHSLTSETEASDKSLMGQLYQMSSQVTPCQIHRNAASCEIVGGSEFNKSTLVGGEALQSFNVQKLAFEAVQRLRSRLQKGQDRTASRGEPSVDETINTPTTKKRGRPRKSAEPAPKTPKKKGLIKFNFKRKKTGKENCTASICVLNESPTEQRKRIFSENERIAIGERVKKLLHMSRSVYIKKELTEDTHCDSESTCPLTASNLLSSVGCASGKQQSERVGRRKVERNGFDVLSNMLDDTLPLLQCSKKRKLEMSRIKIKKTKKQSKRQRSLNHPTGGQKSSSLDSKSLGVHSEADRRISSHTRSSPSSVVVAEPSPSREVAVCIDTSTGALSVENYGDARSNDISCKTEFNEGQFADCQESQSLCDDAYDSDATIPYMEDSEDRSITDAGFVRDQEQFSVTTSFGVQGQDKMDLIINSRDSSNIQNETVKKGEGHVMTFHETLAIDKPTDSSSSAPVLSGGENCMHGYTYRYIEMEGIKFIPFQDLCRIFPSDDIKECLRSRADNEKEKFSAISCSEVEVNFLNTIDINLPTLQIESLLLEEELLFCMSKMSTLSDRTKHFNSSEGDEDVIVVENGECKEEEISDDNDDVIPIDLSLDDDEEECDQSVAVNVKTGTKQQGENVEEIEDFKIEINYDYDFNSESQTTPGNYDVDSTSRNCQTQPQYVSNPRQSKSVNQINHENKTEGLVTETETLHSSSSAQTRSSLTLFPSGSVGSSKGSPLQSAPCESMDRVSSIMKEALEAYDTYKDNGKLDNNIARISCQCQHTCQEYHLKMTKAFLAVWKQNIQLKDHISELRSDVEKLKEEQKASEIRHKAAVEELERIKCTKT